MNAVLGDAIDDIFDDVSARYNLTTRWLEVLGKRNEDLLTNYGIRLARSAAWYNACRLSSLSRNDIAASVTRSAEIFVRDILKPPINSLRFLVRAFRWATSLGRRWPTHDVTADALPKQSLPNRNYYFHIGVGDWTGTFTFRVRSFRDFLREKMPARNRFLSLLLIVTMATLRRARINSQMRGFPYDGACGSAYNLVRIHRFGVTIYLLRETYTMLPDGEDVFVQSVQRFGPMPFLFNSEMRYRARVAAHGMHTLYFMPLLSSNWVGDYHVAPDERHLDSRLTCGWAEAEEHVEKLP